MKRITTSAHAMAVGLYGLMLIIGASWATGAARMSSAYDWYGPYAHLVIGLPITVASIVGGMSALTSHLFIRPDVPMRAELGACAVLAAGFGMYWWSIFGLAATTELLMLGLVIISLARVWQIWRELRRIR